MDTTRTSDEDLLPLANEFAEADPDAWMALVEKTLGGKPYDKLTSKTDDGIGIKPLYTASEEPGPDGVAQHRKALDADSAPNHWDIRSLSSHPDPEEANRQILRDLEKGATSVWVKLDPTGRAGTVIKSRTDMERLLHGVYLDLAPVVLDPGGPSLPPAAYLIHVLDQSGIARESFKGNFGADPLSTLAAVGKVIVPMETLLGRMADLTAYVAKTYPHAQALNVSTSVYHSAGCSEAQELAIAMATATEYLRHTTAAGLSIDQACAQTAFTLTCDTDVFMTMAKLRVARRLWARVAEASGSSKDNQGTTIGAVTAPRMMSRRDPWVNMLRGTAACFAAAIGGADSIAVLPFESAIGLPTRFGRRIARNSQIILQDESSLNRVIDPAGGSWMVESLTDDLAEKAWSLFQDIESRGGMAKVLADGSLAETIAETEVARARKIATRKVALTGVSEFPNIAEDPVETDTPDIEAIVTTADKRAAQAKGGAGTLPLHSDGALMAALMTAAKDDASASTIGAALQGEPTQITPLPQHRLGEDFETLRETSDGWEAEYGQRPRIFIANIGRVADFTARATFAKNLFEAGGVETVAGAGGDDGADIVADFKDSNASAVAVCSTDAIYSEKATALASALKDAGASFVVLAGKPGDTETELRDAGVDDFIYMGCDVLAVLQTTHTQLGVRS